MSGILYIVATPIGNLEDMTFRAVRILKEADLIAAEDTRHSRKLLNHFGIKTPLTSYFDHNQTLKGERILDMLLAGKNIALISDAGTPCISDPGYQLVHDVLKHGLKVVPIPGACAATAALAAAGLPTDSFYFAGFPPAKSGKRRSFLAPLAALSATIILYEAPHRLLATLGDIAEVMGKRQITIARELTKIYEEFITGELPDIIDQISKSKERGELVILIAAAKEQDKEADAHSVEEQLRDLLAKGYSVKDAATMTAVATGQPRRLLYAQALSLR